MATYTVEDPKTGRTVTLEGDSPPTEMELEEIFSTLGGAEVTKPKPVVQPEPEPKPEPEQEEMSFGDYAAATGNWLGENLDVPAGIAGAVTGAKVGAPFGPLGVTAGGVIGGAVGTFGGVLGSQQYKDVDPDYQEAFEAALWSAGIDLATLGAGKFIPDRAWVMAQKKLGLSPQEAAKKVQAKAFSQESLQQTQEMLAKEGATLTPYQTQRATTYNKLQELLADTGLFSRNVMEENATRVNEVIQTEFQRLFNVREGLSSTVLGQQMDGILSAGKDALSSVYERNMDEVMSLIPKTRSVSPTRLKMTLNKIIEDSQLMGTAIDLENNQLYRKALDSSLDKSVVELLQGEIAKLNDVVSIDGRSLIGLEKKLTSLQRKFGTQGTQFYNPEAAAQLQFISGKLKGVYGDLLAKMSPEAAEAYTKAKTQYAKGLADLFPEINKNVVKAADGKGAFENLGQVVFAQGNASHTSALLRSIDEAYELAAKEGSLGSMPFKSAKEAKQALRSSYIAQNMPNILDLGGDVSQYRNLAKKLATPTNEAKLKVLFGEQYPKFRQLLNSIEEVSVKSSGDTGSLLWRSQEYGALRGIMSFGQALAAGGTVLGAGASLTSGAGALAVLLTPYAVAKAITNPKLANKLLGLTTRNFKSVKEQAAFAGIVLNDVVSAMTDEERVQLGEYLEAAASSRLAEEQPSIVRSAPMGL